MSPDPQTSAVGEPGASPATRRRAVFVAGSGRSGTSTLAGVLQQLGLHVPRPEVQADPTNPRGFGEPQWVVDFHNRLLRRAGVQVSDARPQAWFETGKLGMRGGVRDEAADWLREQSEIADELVVKDPRLVWFLGLWRVAAIRCDVAPCFATMLRPPMEVVGSKQQAYGNRVGDVDAMAAWVNLMLHTEQATRGSARIFIRYHDLLQDWTSSIFRAGEVLDLHRVQTAPMEAVRAVHHFVDPSLRRVQRSWDEFEGPQRLREIAEAAWEQLDRLAEPDGETAEGLATLDELREAYTRLYAEAEAVARSSVIAAGRRARARAQQAPAPAATAPTEPQPAASRVPHRVRAMVPARLRRKARTVLDARRNSRP